MHMRIRAWLPTALLAGSLLAAGNACNRSQKEGTVAKEVTVTRADHDREVQVAAGGRLVVRIGWSPGTGYDWFPAGHDEAVLKQDGEAVSEPAKEPMPGAPETRIFVFKALKAGATSLELRSLRPWEKHLPPAEVFRIKVKVAD